VWVRAEYEPQQHAEQKMRWFSAPLAKEALFCQIVPLLRKGTCVVDVLEPQGRVLFRRRVVVEEPRTCYWQTFAELRRDEGRAAASLVDSPAAASPRYGGMTSLLREEIVKPEGGAGAAKVPQNRLPGAIPLDPRWKALGGLQLSTSEGRFVIRSVGPKLYPRPERHVLARWWVNDKPVVPPRRGDGKLQQQQQAEQVVHAQEMSVPAHLPADLGDLKAGDKVGLQVLYVPGGLDLLPKDAGRTLMQHAMQPGKDAVVVPLMSNRLEIAVTEELMRARQAR
jgi:hypothetical protein